MKSSTGNLKKCNVLYIVYLMHVLKKKLSGATNSEMSLIMTKRAPRIKE